MDSIRNFSIIAHIDHGKTTLSDRIIEHCRAVSKREMRELFLDSMDLERERGITIKSQHVRLRYRDRKGSPVILNLIDTPGHVDFTYEVSRSLSACEGALVLIDASQGIEAQTLTNTYIAMDHDLVLVPVLNKIDLPNLQISGMLDQVESVIGVPREETLQISAKTGKNIEQVLQAVVRRIPPPSRNESRPLKALIFDSWYNSYRGVVMLVRVIDGVLSRGDRIRFLSMDRACEVAEIGYHTPKPIQSEELRAGEVGTVIANIRNISEVKIGDTLTHEKTKVSPCRGFREPQSMVFAGFYPTAGATHDQLRDAIERLVLNDSSLVFEPENSPALGIGFRLGFLGLLHKDIIQERLEREYDLNIITTSPSVRYQVVRRDGGIATIQSPSDLPEAHLVDHIREPFVDMVLITPDTYLGPIFKLLQDRRGIHRSMKNLDRHRVQLNYELPLGEILYDFFNRVKAVSRGYASFDYEILEYRRSDLVKLDVLINREAVDALTLIVHREKAHSLGNKLVEKMQGLIPRQLFEVVIQASVGKRVIARAAVKPLRKNVTAKCYGGDVSRKMKLLKKQKEGKKRMKRIGRVDLPQGVFHAALENDG